MSKILVAALYLFVDLSDCEGLRIPILRKASLNGIKGTILLAKEGINGTVAGSEKELRSFLSYLRGLPPFTQLEHKESWTSSMPFQKMKVKLKEEIVTLGVDGVDPLSKVGTYVSASEWNKLIEREDVVLVDTRNDYETSIGTFKGAVDPNTRSFKEFPEWALNHLDKTQPVAMFCTGGIRCEKATSYLLEQGFDQVYHLKGGILKYLEEIPKEKSLWEGSCFVFDERVSVNHELNQDVYELCEGCGHPVLPDKPEEGHHREHCSLFGSNNGQS